MGKHISKLERQKSVLADEAREKALKDALKASVKYKQNFGAVVQEAIELAKTASFSKNGQANTIKRFIDDAKVKTKKTVVEKWLNALVFLADNLEEKCPKWFKDDAFILALLELSKCQHLWLKAVEDWKPKSNNAYQQFNELTKYLLADYAFPDFMKHIFFHREDYFFIQEFIFLAQGGSIKQINSTIPLTQKMKALFLKTPEGFRVFEAFRYAQVLGLGGDEELAHRIAYSTLGRNEERNELFWEQFIRILVAGGMFSHDKIGEMIDYIQSELNQNQGYTLKGRTLQSLIRQSDEWHHLLTKNQRKMGLTFWNAVFIHPFEIEEGKDEKKVIYKMVELLSNKELTEEGSKMHHCVGSYSNYCEKGRTRIVSLRKYSFGMETERMATIEVDVKAKRIVQAKYRYNKTIAPKASLLMQDWASQENLQLSSYL
jgi:PcfJ-like protein